MATIGAGDAPGPGLPCQDVAGKLFAHEPVERQVRVERIDDVVAIAGELGNRVVGIVAGGVGVMRHVHPVSAPALAVMRRGQQPLDHASEGVGAVVADEIRDLLGSRRQADQVEAHASDERSPVRVRDRADAGGPVSGRDESIDRVGRPPGWIGRRLQPA